MDIHLFMGLFPVKMISNSFKPIKINKIIILTYFDSKYWEIKYGETVRIWENNLRCKELK